MTLFLRHFFHIICLINISEEESESWIVIKWCQLHENGSSDIDSGLNNVRLAGHTLPDRHLNVARKYFQAFKLDIYVDKKLKIFP